MELCFVFYHHTVTVPFLNEILPHLHDRFESARQLLTAILSVLPSAIASAGAGDPVPPAEALSMHLLHCHGEDLPNFAEVDVVKAEVPPVAVKCAEQDEP